MQIMCSATSALSGVDSLGCPGKKAEMHIFPGHVRESMELQEGELKGPVPAPAHAR